MAIFMGLLFAEVEKTIAILTQPGDRLPTQHPDGRY
jgi:hypothetical protein